ncbi:MAG: chemotaxis protein, partial [Deltaproteobacteria bacterium]|nr:chemotaxis protein [Deltaproteobacteria bacterium]
AGGAIETLKGSVVASSQAASVIAATSEQQSTGVGQVAAAMASIDKAMQQISDGTTQLYDAANRLSDLARELQKMVETYEV